MLTKEELKRYNRQLILPERGIKRRGKLKAAKMLAVGLTNVLPRIIGTYMANYAVKITVIRKDYEFDGFTLSRQQSKIAADIVRPFFSGEIYNVAIGIS